jgi:Cys-rich repeat protein
MVARTLVRSLLMGALAAAVGCASATPAQQPDMAVSCGDGSCAGGCTADKDCKAPTGRCDVASHSCVACLMDTDCGGGKVCGPTHSCTTGCSAQQGCGDLGVCQLDAGACVGCLSNSDCTNPSLAYCDPAQGKCVPCLPSNDKCPQGQFCLQQGNNYGCVPGCKTNNDCGASGDGGASQPFCDPNQHKCVDCLKDMDCPSGKVCKNGMCSDGCTTQQKCAGTLSCCNMVCSDTTTDYMNCGMCGMACTNGYNCCNSTCSNPANDAQNCGGCGITCAAAHGVPTCVLRKCAIAMCDPGWSDCNGVVGDGCEVNTDSNVGNCGACNSPCSLANASPKCVGGKCAISACTFPFADCNMMPADGCEVNTFTDAMNCGGCGMACNLPNATAKCTLGMCAIAVCNPGWLDCNNNPADGCEVNSVTDVNHCGNCTTMCSSTGGAPACNGGRCGIACNPGFADCDNNPANGCEVNLNTDPNHCGACMTSCNNLTAHASSGACMSGMCVVTGCQMGYYDVDGQWGDGCECLADSFSAMCAAPTGLGNVPIGTSIVRTGNLVPSGNEDWFQVTFNGDHSSLSFHAQVQLTTNPNGWFVFDVFSDCAPTSVNCADAAGTGLIWWEIYWKDQTSGAYNPIKDFGNANTVYIRVRRIAGAVTCDNYTLTISG